MNSSKLLVCAGAWRMLRPPATPGMYILFCCSPWILGNSEKKFEVESRRKSSTLAATSSPIYTMFPEDGSMCENTVWENSTCWDNIQSNQSRIRLQWHVLSLLPLMSFSRWFSFWIQKKNSPANDNVWIREYCWCFFFVYQSHHKMIQTPGSLIIIRS